MGKFVFNIHVYNSFQLIGWINNNNNYYNNYDAINNNNNNNNNSNIITTIIILSTLYILCLTSSKITSITKWLKVKTLQSMHVI